MIELKHLSKTFETAGGRVDALKDVSLTIPDGDVYGIIGMSGAGKSTLVRCINMLERPTEGEVIVNGQRLDTMTPAQLRAARREITMIFQRFNLLMQRNCLANVCFPMELSGLRGEKKWREQRALELLEIVGLKDRPRPIPRSSPADSSSALPSPAPSPRTPKFCSATRLRARSTPRRRARSSS